MALSTFTWSCSLRHRPSAELSRLPQLRLCPDQIVTPCSPSPSLWKTPFYFVSRYLLTRVPQKTNNICLFVTGLTSLSVKSSSFIHVSSGCFFKSVCVFVCVCVYIYIERESHKFMTSFCASQCHWFRGL